MIFNSTELSLLFVDIMIFSKAQTGAPCLSFDIIQDQLGEARTEVCWWAFALPMTLNSVSLILFFDLYALVFLWTKGYTLYIWKQPIP